MSRTAPEIYFRTGTDTGKSETRVLAAKGLFTVLHSGKPFSLTTDRPPGQPPIYQRTSFATKAPAENLAKKLNTLFGVDEFRVFDVEFV
jgi:hypothetical protein